MRSMMGMGRGMGKVGGWSIRVWLRRLGGWRGLRGRCGRPGAGSWGWGDNWGFFMGVLWWVDEFFLDGMWFLVKIL